ncbi:MAG: hypothetical protein KUL82_10195 [Bdellovibrio sp.]|nr:hypothetical protein [Bdellovibrio sp.]
MKKLVLMVLFMASALGSKASANSAQGLIEQLKSLNGATGRVASNIEKESTGVCKVAVTEDDYGVSVSFEGTGLYFTPIAHISSDATLEDNNTLLISTNPNRVGGDVCGDWGGAVRYKKTISLEKNVLKISESFRCSLEGFKKYNLISACVF